MTYSDPEKQRAYQREWRAQRRREWFSGRCCLMCGMIEELEIHHIDPTIKVSHRIWSWAPARRNAELAKCEVLCHDCHLKETWQGRRALHGTTTRYNKWRCRCPACRTAKAMVNKERVR